MSLVRYSSAGRLASLRGAIGRLMPDGRAQLRGVARDVPIAELERPRYWCLADGAWSGPHRSWGAACRWLADLLRVWQEPGLAWQVESAEASVDGLTLYVDGCRVRVVAGGDRAPVGG